MRGRHVFSQLQLVSRCSALSLLLPGARLGRTIRAAVPAADKPTRPGPGPKGSRLAGGPAGGRDRPRRLVVDLPRSGARRARAPDRHLEPEPEGRRGRLSRGRGDRHPGPRRLFPTAQIYATPRRSRVRRRCRLAAGGGTIRNISNSFSLTAAASWVPDLWGKVAPHGRGRCRQRPGQRRDVASARLSAQGQLASDYVQLRVSDELKRLLDSAVKAYSESLRIAENQYKAGTADQSDGLAGAGAAAKHAGAADCGRRQPRPARARDRRAGRQTAGRGDDRPGRRSACPRSPRIFRRGCPRRFCSGDPISRPPSAAWPPPTRRSASPRPRSSPTVTLSAQITASRRRCSRSCCRHRAGSGRWARTWRRRSSTPGRATPRSSRRAPASTRRSRIIGRPC